MALDATPGGADANSYLTIAEATESADVTLHDSDWTDAAEDDREVALQQATSLLDRLLVWGGTKASTSQALEWPQRGLYYPDGTPVPTNAVPAQIKELAWRLARRVLTADPLAGGSSGTEIVSMAGITFKSDGGGGSRAIPESLLWGIPDGWILDEREPAGVGNARITRA